MKPKARITLGVSLLIIVVLLTVPAYAIQTRSNDVYVSLNFSNNTAVCKCEISADSSNDWISATMELWKGTTMVNSWSLSGQEYVSMEESEGVARYKTYRLLINYSINGIPKTPVEISRFYG